MSIVRVQLGGQTVQVQVQSSGFARANEAVSEAAASAAAAAASAAAASATLAAAALKANNLSDLTSASTARANLGLGSIATQSASAVAITGGAIAGITDLAVADGGTGASDASNARTNLGLAIGTNVQAYDADLQAIAALTSAADKVPYATGAGTWAMADLTSFARSLLATANNSAFLVALGQIASTALGYLATWTGAVNRTVNSRLGDIVSVKDFGAVGDGVTDDTAAFNLAIAYANAKGGTDRANVVGTTIFIPQGRYPVGQLNPIAVSDVQFSGLGQMGGTVLLHSYDGATFRWLGPVGDTIVGGGLTNVRHEYLGTPGASACIVEVARANALDFSSWHFFNIACALRLGTSSSATAAGIIANNWSGGVRNMDAPLIDLCYGAGFEAVGHYVFVSGVLTPPIQVGNFTSGSAVVPVPSNTGFFAGQDIIGTARVPGGTTVLSVGRATTTGTFTNGSAVVTGIPSTVGFVAGQPLIAVDSNPPGASRIPAGTTVLSVDSATQITMSANATSTGDTTIYGLITMSANASSTGTATLSGDMSTVAGRSYIRGTTGGWDTCQISNALIERFDQGISFGAGTGQVYQHFCLSNVTMDYIRRHCIYAETSAGGVINSVSSDNLCWFVSWETATLQMVGTAGVMDDWNLQGKVPISGAEALSYNVPSAKRCSFSLAVGGINRLQNAPAALYFLAGSKGFTAIDCTGNDDLTAFGLPFRADWGITVGANCDEYLITGSRMSGTGGFFNWFAGNTAGSTKRQVTANGDPASYAAQQTGGIYVLPASTVAFTNTNGFAVEVIISGGTVTQIAKNGVNTGLTSGSFIVGPGETLTPTYSSAPTALFFGLN